MRGFGEVRQTHTRGRHEVRLPLEHHKWPAHGVPERHRGHRDKPCLRRDGGGRLHAGLRTRQPLSHHREMGGAGVPGLRHYGRVLLCRVWRLAHRDEPPHACLRHSTARPQRRKCRLPTRQDGGSLPHAAVQARRLRRGRVPRGVSARGQARCGGQGPDGAPSDHDRPLCRGHYHPA